MNVTFSAPLRPGLRHVAQRSLGFARGFGKNGENSGRRRHKMKASLRNQIGLFLLLVWRGHSCPRV
jgi:hypothetical protein